MMRKRTYFEIPDKDRYGEIEKKMETEVENWREIEIFVKRCKNVRMEYVVGFGEDYSATRVLAAGSPSAGGAIEAAEREPAESAVSIHPRSTRHPRVAARRAYGRSYRRKLIARSSLERREGSIRIRPR